MDASDIRFARVWHPIWDEGTERPADGWIRLNHIPCTDNTESHLNLPQRIHAEEVRGTDYWCKHSDFIISIKRQNDLFAKGAEEVSSMQHGKTMLRVGPTLPDGIASNRESNIR